MNDRFNEGLEQGIEFGILKERKRIIKLLEDEIRQAPNSIPKMSLLDVIALIKGENK